MTCSVHGSALAPRQPTAPRGTGALEQLGGLTATVTFLPEGLRAVVGVERKQP